MNFKDYLELDSKIQALIYLAEGVDSLNEEELTESVLKKLGLHAKKSKGLLDYIKQFSSGVGKLFLHAIKGDKEKAKELVKSIDKSEVIDFLMKLDTLTLHMVTGPIHMIDAITGWHLGADLSKKLEKAEDMIGTVKSAIIKVKDGIKNLFTNDKERQSKLLGYADNLEAELA